MQRLLLSVLIIATGFLGACKKEKAVNSDNYGNGPRTNVPASLQGNWMYGNFSMTEYWSQNPADYLGNAFEMAIAFHFNANGTYEQYFTSKTVSGGVATYHQSLTKGTVVISEADKKITTHANTAHYKQTKNGTTIVNRDLDDDEITKITNYTFETGTGPNGTKVIHLRLHGTVEPLTFLQKF
mgnify:CR=1 FL=1